jgi:hypothetical protein
MNNNLLLLTSPTTRPTNGIVSYGFDFKMQRNKGENETLIPKCQIIKKAHVRTTIP